MFGTANWIWNEVESPSRTRITCDNDQGSWSLNRVCGETRLSYTLPSTMDIVDALDAAKLLERNTTEWRKLYHQAVPQSDMIVSTALDVEQCAGMVEAIATNQATLTDLRGALIDMGFVFSSHYDYPTFSITSYWFDIKKGVVSVVIDNSGGICVEYTPNSGVKSHILITSRLEPDAAWPEGCDIATGIIACLPTLIEFCKNTDFRKIK